MRLKPSPGSACQAARAEEEAALWSSHDNTAADPAVDPQAVSALDGEGGVPCGAVAEREKGNGFLRNHFAFVQTCNVGIMFENQIVKIFNNLELPASGEE